MIHILSLETSTSVCSVALHQNGVLVSIKEIDVIGAHAERIMGLIDEVMSESRLSKNNLSAIAVSSGPGSYTGLRIGVSTAKGLAFGLNIPLIGVNTLKALSLSAIEQMTEKGVSIPLIDARRTEVYCQVFSEENEPLSDIHSEVLSENSFENYLRKGPVYFCGDGVAKTKTIILHPMAVYLSSQISANQIGKLAYLKFENEDFEDLAYFVPNYLKEFKVLHSKKNPFKR